MPIYKASLWKVQYNVTNLKTNFSATKTAYISLNKNRTKYSKSVEDCIGFLVFMLENKRTKKQGELHLYLKKFKTQVLNVEYLGYVIS